MMSNDTLSQEGAGTLPNGTQEGYSDRESMSAEDILRAYASRQEENATYAPMPTLDLIHEHFAHHLRLGLSNFIHRDVTVTVAPARVEEYAEFIRQLAFPTNLNLIQVTPLRGLGFLICDPELIFLIVDNLFGSDGRYQIDTAPRDFTPTERRIMHRLLDVVFEECQKAWRPVYPIELIYVRSETNVQFASIVSHHEAIVVLTLQIEVGTRGGKLQFCLPYSMLEPIQGVLSSAVQVERREGEEGWTQQLVQELKAADMELVATLTQAQVTLKQLLHLKKGDVITLDIPKTVVVDIAGIPVLECQYGTLQGKYALKVERILTGAKQFTEPSLSREVEPHNE